MLKSAEAMKKSLSSYCKWAYNLRAVLEDDSNCNITVQLTSNSAEVGKLAVASQWEILRGLIFTVLTQLTIATP